ncbi:MAG: helix-turn-helix domain-containing protein [Propionibacteriaceae bacterium]|jgi:predicted transcriptional regulator YheO|nr:helix-turn-helix domain-containing protein [Propionibacteriaceae bacterium]
MADLTDAAGASALAGALATLSAAGARLVVEAPDGTPLAELSLNLLAPAPPAAEPEPPADVADLATTALVHAVAAVGVPVDLMHKRHKLAVVADLDRQGFFRLKNSVERAAAALHVTRYTVYNYLKELGA